MNLKSKICAVFASVLMMIACAGCRSALQGAVNQAQISAGSGLSDHTESKENTVPTLEEKINEYLENMTLEEKAAQLFIVQPEAIVDAGTAVAAGNTTREAINETPVGGFIYFSDNLQDAEQTSTMLDNVQKYSMDRIGLPAFLSVDEEGGTVARVAGSGKFDVTDVGDMADIGRSGDIEAAQQAGNTIGSYLSALGFNVDFAPVADVLSNTENTVVQRRSFGNDPETVSEMAIAVSEGLRENGVYSTYKHFPGHGATAGDTHEGYAYTDKTLEELETCELIPFQRCIEADASFIMVGHISLPNVIGDNTPASMSKTIITDLLREQMGYDGIVITDAMNMGAIAEEYSSAEAAVKALQAGADIILMPEDFDAAYQGILDAVKDGTLTEDRINESLIRVLKIKLEVAGRYAVRI